MKKLALFIVAALIAGCGCGCTALPTIPGEQVAPLITAPTRYTDDGRRVCATKESLHNGCIVIVQGRCNGVVRDDYDAMNACI